MARFRKPLLGVFIGLFVASVLAYISIDIYYYIELPNAPDQSRERTQRMVVSHGSVRYGSERELHALRAVEELFPMGAGLFLAALLLGLRWGIFHIGPTGRVQQGESVGKEENP